MKNLNMTDPYYSNTLSKINYNVDNDYIDYTFMYTASILLLGLSLILMKHYYTSKNKQIITRLIELENKAKKQ